MSNEMAALFSLIQADHLSFRNDKTIQGSFKPGFRCLRPQAEKIAR